MGGMGVSPRDRTHMNQEWLVGLSLQLTAADARAHQPNLGPDQVSDL